MERKRHLHHPNKRHYHEKRGSKPRWHQICAFIFEAEVQVIFMYYLVFFWSLFDYWSYILWRIQYFIWSLNDKWGQSKDNEDNHIKECCFLSLNFSSFPEIQVRFEVTALSQEWPVVILCGNKKNNFSKIKK
jgi:hypothetical protein